MRIVSIVVAVVLSSSIAPAQTTSAAVQAFERLKSLEGEWIDVDGVFGTKGAVAVTYEVTGGGHTVVETFPANTPNEMVTVYHLAGDQVALTHYCTSNTQPHMRSPGLVGNVVRFAYASGTNIDPKATSHMHTATIEFVSNDEIKSTWENWTAGKPDHGASFRVVRKK
jgi:hypothetical protein